MIRLIRPATAACLAAMLLHSTALAENLTTKDGKVFNNIKVSGETPDKVKIIHDGGISLILKSQINADFFTQHELSPPVSTGSTNDEGTDWEATLAAFKANVPSFTTKDGRTFQSKDVTKVEPSGLKLMTTTGIVKLKFTELKTATQAAFNYDPLKAATFEAEAEKARQEQAAIALRISNANSEVESFSSHVRLYLAQNVGKGWICSAEVLEDRDVDVVTSRAGSPLSGPKVIYESQTRTETIKVGVINRVIVFGLPSFNNLPADLQSRRQWSGKVYRIGNFNSVSASNGKSETIIAAHIDRAEAVRLIAKNGNSAFYNDSVMVKKDEISTRSGTFTGTGFALTMDGYVGTAAHVVKQANSITVSVKGESVKARVVAINESQDVAILKIDSSVTLQPLALAKTGALKAGADLFCVGYPLVGQLGVNPKLTKGTLNSLTGLADDPNSIQMSVQIQPGNSGGPVCDSQGRVIGIVSQTGSTIAGARGSAGAVPQNVNFAAKADLMIDLTATVPELKLPATVDSGPSPEERVLGSSYLITVTTGDDTGNSPSSN
ncbi:MAG: trypsin-like peptidase domain-containing protein [Verrucomicrobiaceae bacterium]|nr:trypsin-like peptidase domain-containing protein [Verrucomicrobiaceae bacterium]